MTNVPVAGCRGVALGNSGAPGLDLQQGLGAPGLLGVRALLNYPFEAIDQRG